MTSTPHALLSWRSLLDEIYGAEVGASTAVEVASLLESHEADGTARRPWDENDAWLITYPDQFQRPPDAPLAVLREFYDTHLADALNGIHILPFSPWSSDDGYSVKDYHAVEPAYGSWDDVEAIGETSSLMVDAVVNHMSAQSDWFRRYLAGDEEYRGFFRSADPDADLSRVTRARQHPLLTEFETTNGNVHVWTTFSADQVDLDFRNPAVLVRILEVVLSYAARGARAIRFDAIGFLWKDESTSSIHLPQTHAIVQFLRACLDHAYPGTMVVTETNVPQAENYSYFGDGSAPEAHMVYQFALPPLVLHTILTGDSSTLTEWASRSTLDVPGTSFLNFLSSHDGVGVRPVEDLLARAELERLMAAATARGGMVGYRGMPDGSSSPYELNATWFDLVSHPESEDLSIARHLASHAAMLAMRGIPAIYVHSLFGSSNDLDALESTGHRRSLNRAKFVDMAGLGLRLGDPMSREARCLAGIKQLLGWRRSSHAFHPDAAQTVLDLPPQLFGVRRDHPDGSSARVLVNVSADEVTIELDDGPGKVHGFGVHSVGWTVTLRPWGTAWVI